MPPVCVQGRIKEVTSTNGQDKHRLVSFKLLRDLKIKVTDHLFLISHKKERLKGVRRKAERGSEGLNEITSLLCSGKEYNEQTILRWEEVDL